MFDTSIYYRFSEEIDDRFDENYNHLRYDEINRLLSKSRFENILPIGDKQVLKEITSGKTPRGIKYQEEGVPFLGASNIINGEVDIESCPKIEQEMHEGVLKSSKVKKGDILITMAGTIGRCAIYSYEEEANCNQAVAILRLNEDIVIPHYVVEYLDSVIGDLFFQKFQHISSQPNINLNEIKRIKVILPDKTQQKTILNEINKIRAELHNIIKMREDKLIEIKVSIIDELEFKSQIPKTYFFHKGRESTNSCFSFFEDLDRLHYLFNQPKGKLYEELIKIFHTVELNDACSEPIKRGEQPVYMEEGEVKVIKTIDLKNSYIDMDNCLRVSQEFYDEKVTAQIFKKDILIASTGYGSLGKVDIYEDDEPAMVDGHISILRLNSDYDPYFILYFLRSPLGQIQFEKWFSGSSGQIEIQPGDLGKFLIPSASDNGISFVRQCQISKKISGKLKEANLLRSKADLVRDKLSQNFQELIFRNF